MALFYYSFQFFSQTHQIGKILIFMIHISVRFDRSRSGFLLLVIMWVNYEVHARSHKSRAAVDYTLIGVEPQGPTRSVWPIATVANDSQSHLVASRI